MHFFCYLCSVKRRLLIWLNVCVCVLSLHSEVIEQGYTETFAQVRLDLTYTLPIRHGVSMTFFEDLRLDMLPFSPATVFDMSLTSVTLSYSPVKYVKLDAAYMLKINGAVAEESSEYHWSEPNNYIKHRVYGGVMGMYWFGALKVSLREYVLCDMRFDYIDPRTTNKYSWTMRHYLNFSYGIKPVNLTPYVWTELANTLNANEYTLKNGRQYLERWRSAAGVKWKIERENGIPVTLNFFYRYDWGRFRSAMLVQDDIYITTHRKNEHVLGFGVEL